MARFSKISFVKSIWLKIAFIILAVGLIGFGIMRWMRFREGADDNTDTRPCNEKCKKPDPNVDADAQAYDDCLKKDCDDNDNTKFKSTYIETKCIKDENCNDLNKNLLVDPSDPMTSESNICLVRCTYNKGYKKCERKTQAGGGKLAYYNKDHNLKECRDKWSAEDAPKTTPRNTTSDSG
jgi:hypothetical protein